MLLKMLKIYHIFLWPAIFINAVSNMETFDSNIDTIKPFFSELNNNNKKQFNINEEKHIPFFKSLSSFQLKLLYEYKIIEEKIYSNIVGKQYYLLIVYQQRLNIILNLSLDVFNMVS